MIGGLGRQTKSTNVPSADETYNQQGVETLGGILRYRIPKGIQPCIAPSCGLPRLGDGRI